MIRFATIAALAILGLVLFSLSGGKGWKNLSGIVSNAFSGQPHLDQAQFQSVALTEINKVRSHLQLPSLSTDPELERALYHIGNSQRKPSQIDLDTLFNILRDLFPGAQFLSATLVLDNQTAGLLRDLRTWRDVANEDYESIATFVFKDGVQLGCLAVLTRRLPSFNLAAANRDGGRFFNRCPRCGKSHALELGRKSQTLILSCPDCDRPYDVLAMDVAGRFRRAPEFLTGSFELPPNGREPARDPRQRLRQVWGRVLEHCSYEFDSKNQNRGEVWKTPAQTWIDRAGDCEDTAILLADVLIGIGYDARVAVGWNVHIGQHAWTVVRIGREQFVLETTVRHEAGEALPDLLPVARAADEYRPEQLFDRKRLYFREGENAGPHPCRDYWSDFEWPAIELPRGAE